MFEEAMKKKEEELTQVVSAYEKAHEAGENGDYETAFSLLLNEIEPRVNVNEKVSQGDADDFLDQFLF